MPVEPIVSAVKVAGGARHPAASGDDVGVGGGILMAIARTVSPGTRISMDSIVLGLMAALLVGVLAGFLPARQAALQEPVDALQ